MKPINISDAGCEPCNYMLNFKHIVTDPATSPNDSSPIKYASEAGQQIERQHPKEMAAKE
jgi:hypothetical protein